MTDTITSIDDLDIILNNVQSDFEKISYREPLALHLMELERAHQFLFDESVSPAGDPWPDISDATKAAKGRDDILIDTETLMRSLTSQSDGAVRSIDRQGRGWMAVFGTSVPYSHVHQEGLGVDQREHVGTSEHLVDQLADDLANWTVAELVSSRLSPSVDLFS